MSRIAAISITICLVLTLAACSSTERHHEVAATAAPAMDADGESRSKMAMMTFDQASPVAESSDATAASQALESMSASRKLVRNGTIALEVDSPGEVARLVESIAESHGGYVSGMNGHLVEGDREAASLSIRVEPRRFMPAMASLRELGKVQSESIATEDVGKAYADIEARLRTKQAAAARMREIMDTKTGSLNDVISAEQQLGMILEQIEQLEGQRRYYDAQVGLSTINVNLFEPGAPVVHIAEPVYFWAPLAEAFHDGKRALVTVLAGVTFLVTAFGPWLLLALLGWMLYRRSRRLAA